MQLKRYQIDILAEIVERQERWRCSTQGKKFYACVRRLCRYRLKILLGETSMLWISLSFQFDATVIHFYQTLFRITTALHKCLDIIIWVSIWNQSLLNALSDLEWDCSLVCVLAIFDCRWIWSYRTKSPMSDPPSTFGERYNAQTRSWMHQDHESVAQMSSWVSIWNQAHFQSMLYRRVLFTPHEIENFNNDDDLRWRGLRCAWWTSRRKSKLD